MGPPYHSPCNLSSLAKPHWPLPWKINTKTLTFTKPSTRAPKKFITILSSYSSSSQSLAEPHKTSVFNKGITTSTSRAVQFDDNLTRNQRLKRDLLEKLEERDSDPIQILKDDGDWSQELFWVVIRFLQQSSRSIEIFQVFELWKTLDNSRSNAFNYENILGLLAEEELAEEVVSVLRDMKRSEISPSSEIYYLVIRCFTQKGRFEDALFYLKEMKEMNLKPTTEIYDGLIQAYANHKMYDEMDQCLKKMKTTGCSPDHITYNLLIREFSRAGLLKRMERTYQTLLSKRMGLQSSTVVAMIEAYANFGMMENMEMVYRRVMNSKKTHLMDDLIRKVAGVYIENHMFSRLDDLGYYISKRTGRTDMVWCLRILSHACLLSRKGMDSIVQQMETERAPWNVTVANIMLLACLKMKDLKHLKFILSELPAQCVKPDIVTFGILFDASRLGLDMSKDLNTWTRMGLLNEAVEINTDSLVLTAFGKGHFLQACEDKYSSLKSNSRKNQVLTYRHLINMVIEHNEQHYTERKVPAME